MPLVLPVLPLPSAADSYLMSEWWTGGGWALRLGEYCDFRPRAPALYVAGTRGATHVVTSLAHTERAGARGN